MNTEKVLPITLDIDFTVNLMDCLPLCMISAKDNLKNWINQNFMLPVAYLKTDGALDYIITDGVRYGANYRNPETVLRHCFVCGSIMRNVKSIVELLIDRLDEDWYSVIFVDQYYIKGTAAYQQWHYSHEIFIYGYDKNRRIFKAVSYGRKMFMLDISFEDLEVGFQEVFSVPAFTEEGWHEYTLMLYQFIKHTEEYPYNNETFINKLTMYAKGVLPDRIYYEDLLYMHCNKSQCYFGLNATEAMIQKMRMDKETFLNQCTGDEKYKVFESFSAIYKYFEFHKGLLKRISYYASDFNTSIEYQSSIINLGVMKGYEKIVKACEVIKALYLKLKILSNKKDDERIIREIDKVIEILEWIGKFEPEVLGRLLMILTQDGKILR